jgi:Synergist-CTERM protein sorting domain-containing protein
MKGKKFLALAAALVVAFSGVAWAVTFTINDYVDEGEVTSLVGHNDDDYALSSVIAAVPVAGPVVTNAAFGGPATLTGNILQVNTTNAGNTGQDLRVRLFAPADDEFALSLMGGAAAANQKMYGVASVTNGVAVSAPNDVNLLRTVINTAETDDVPSRNRGTVIVTGANANAPLWNAGNNSVYNNGRLGTFVENGTFAVTHRNSLGLGGVALVGDDGVEPVLTIRDTTDITFGQTEVGNRIGNQPLVLTRNLERTNPAATVRGIVDIGGTTRSPQSLYFIDGLWQSVGGLPAANQGYHTFAAAANQAILEVNANNDPRPGWPLAIADANAQPGRPRYFATLVKRGLGTLYIGSDSTKDHIPGVGGDTGSATGSYPGAAHFGGTEVEGGLLQVNGGTANNDVDRYKGSLGATWQSNARDTYFANTVYVTGVNDGWDAANPDVTIRDVTNGVANDNPGDAVAPEVKALHNPLTLTGDGRVEVDRTQVFTFFRGTEGTAFRAKEFTQAGESLTPEVHVRLAHQDSDFGGTLSGQFNLILDSMETFAPTGPTFYNAPAGGANLTNIAQARLTLGNADNDVEGTTLVADGVLAVAGQGSIGSVSLQVGETAQGNTAAALARTEARSAATFVGLSSDVFTLPVRVESTKNGLLVDGFNAAAWAGTPIFARKGALAAERDTVTRYSDVTIAGGVEINPRSVYPTFAYDQDNFTWLNEQDRLDTWIGVVQFGAVSPDVYRLTGTTTNKDRFLVSNGTLFLGSYPVGVAGNANPFGEIRIRQSATLSIGDDVNDFSDYFDVAVEDNSRVRVIVHSGDITGSRIDALRGDALFKAREIDYTLLGTGDHNADRRLTIQLDLATLEYSLKAGDWIKVITSDTSTEFNNLHRRTQTGTGAYEDYKKVRIVDEAFRDLEDWAVADLDIDSHTILVNVFKDFERTPETPPVVNPDFTFDAAGVVATTSEISGTVAVTGAPVSLDVTFELFRGGVEQTTALATQIDATDSKGVAEYKFVPADAGLTEFGAGTTFVVKASANGYESSTRSVPIPGGTTPPVGTGGSSGCDAGFGAFALLAAAGAVTLLRKKG